MFNNPPLPTTVEKVRVFVTLTDDSSFFGDMWVTNEVRLQDMLNDNRKFIPIERDMVHRGDKSLVLVNKNSIQTIEERYPNGNPKLIKDRED